MLIDAGLSWKETKLRLFDVGISPASIKAVCVTHEHHDHVSGLGVLYRRMSVSLYANAATIDRIETREKLNGLPWNVFSNGSLFPVGGFRVEPFSVPHDASDPVGFIISRGAARIGVVTDMGTPTELVRDKLRQCDVMVVECNHDGDLLRDSARPWSLKQRIQGRRGHLSNDQAVEVITQVAGEGTGAIYLAHLSADCNNPETALRCVKKALGDRGFDGIKVNLAYPDRVSEVFCIRIK
jgi:phosphoribosyl 1,2-cyclic phosphodiesterase